MHGAGRVKNLFTFWNIQIFVVLNISDVMMSINHEREYIFENISLNQNSVGHETYWNNGYNLGQHFSKIIWVICRFGAKFQVIFNLQNLLQLFKNQLWKISSFPLFCELERLQTIDINY